jgi:hypothetical protein
VMINTETKNNDITLNLYISPPRSDQNFSQH